MPRKMQHQKQVPKHKIK